jgi:hypothetical protein
VLCEKPLAMTSKRRPSWWLAKEHPSRPRALTTTSASIRCRWRPERVRGQLEGPPRLRQLRAGLAASTPTTTGASRRRGRCAAGGGRHRHALVDRPRHHRPRGRGRSADLLTVHPSAAGPRRGRLSAGSSAGGRPRARGHHDRGLRAILLRFRARGSPVVSQVTRAQELLRYRSRGEGRPRLEQREPGGAVDRPPRGRTILMRDPSILPPARPRLCPRRHAEATPTPSQHFRRSTPTSRRRLSRRRRSPFADGHRRSSGEAVLESHRKGDG